MNRIGMLALAAALWTSSAMAQQAETVGERLKQAKLTLDLEKATLRKVVTEVVAKTGLQYIAPDSILDNETLTLHVKDMPASSLLRSVAETLNLRLALSKETQTLVISRNRPASKGKKKMLYEPELEHEDAMKIIQQHAVIAKILEAQPNLEFDLKWDDEDRTWEAEFRRGGKKVADVKLAEYDNFKHRIVEVDVQKPKEKKKEKPVQVKEAPAGEQKGDF